jgi:hypothetical protein
VRSPGQIGAGSDTQVVAEVEEAIGRIDSGTTVSQLLGVAC